MALDSSATVAGRTQRRRAERQQVDKGEPINDKTENQSTGVQGMPPGQGIARRAVQRVPGQAGQGHHQGNRGSAGLTHYAT